MATKTEIRIVNCTEATFDALRESHTLNPETGYAVTPKSASKFYAYTPDGEGCIFYDTERQMREDVGF